LLRTYIYITCTYIRSNSEIIDAEIIKCFAEIQYMQKLIACTKRFANGRRKIVHDLTSGKQIDGVIVTTATNSTNIRRTNLIVKDITPLMWIDVWENLK